MGVKLFTKLGIIYKWRWMMTKMKAEFWEMSPVTDLV